MLSPACFLRLPSARYSRLINPSARIASREQRSSSETSEGEEIILLRRVSETFGAEVEPTTA